MAAPAGAVDPAGLVGVEAAVNAPKPRRDPGWLRRYWPLFLVAAALAFGIPETVGVVNDGEGGTLTEVTQEWLGVDEGATTAGWVVLTTLLVGFAIWFPIHLRGWWPWERRPEDDVGGD